MPLPSVATSTKGLPVIPIEAQALKPFSFSGFPLGLNTNIPANQLYTEELSECVNLLFNKGGRLETRPAVVSHISDPTTSNAAYKVHKQISIGGTNRELIIDANDVLYYNNSGTLTTIGVLEGEPIIFPFKNVAIICDGSYLKFLDGVAGANLKMAYDSGTGSSGFQFDNRSLTNDTSLALGNGTNTRVSTKFTSQAWTSGWTIPPTTVHAYLSKTGSPTGNLLMVLRKVSDDSVLATKTMLDVSTLTGTATEYTETFESGDITTQMSPSIEYYISLEYSGGDVSNYVVVHCYNVGSGGDAYHYAGSWSADAAKNPLMALRPGMPPKCSFGKVYKARLHLAGDPDNKGYDWVSNSNSYLDFSTPNQAGYIGAVDDGNNSYEIGAMAVLYNDLYVYGTQDEPYLCKLTGDSPSDFKLPPLYQNIWTTKKLLVSSKNDLWSTSSDGTDALSGVQEYGDTRTFSQSDPIADKLRDCCDTDTAFCEYWPEKGLYLLVMPAYHRILAVNTKLAVPEPTGIGTRYPWGEFELYRRDLTDSSTYKWVQTSGNEYELQAAAGGDSGISTQPDFITLNGKKITEGTAGSLNDHEWDYALDQTSSFMTIHFCDASGDPDTTGIELRELVLPTSLSAFGGSLHVGTSHGISYKFTESDYKDLSDIQFYPKFRTAYIPMPLKEVRVEKYQFLANSRFGAQFTAALYINGLEATAEYTKTINLPISDDVTVDELTMDVDDALFSVDPETSPLWRDIWCTCMDVQWRVYDTYLMGAKLYFNGFIFGYRPLEM